MEVIRTIPSEENPWFPQVSRLLYPEGSPRHSEREDINQEALVATYVVMKDGVPLARAALYRGDALQLEGAPVWMVGNYECAPQQEVAVHLLGALEEEAKNSGAGFLVGPMNGSTWDNYRFSVAHDFPNFLLEPYHHLYYVQQFRDAGFQVISRYASNVDVELACDMPPIFEKEQGFALLGVRIRSIDLGHFDAELERLHPFVDATFRGNFLYSPISLSRFKEKYRAATAIIDRHFVLVAEDRDGRPVGFVFSYDDAYSRRGKSLIIKTLARAKEKQYAGLGHVLANRVIRLARERGYRSVVHAFIIDSGDATLVSGNFAGRPYKEYLLFGKPL